MKYYRMFIPQHSSYPLLENLEQIPFNLIKQNQCVPDWKPVNLLLQGSRIPDYTRALFASRICSEKLKNIIEAYLTQLKKRHQWLLIVAKSTENQLVKYYELHFTEEQNVLNLNQTEFCSNGTVKVSHLSASKIKGKHCFSIGNSRRALVVSEELKEAIQKAGCTNIVFSKASVIDDLNITDRATG